MAITPHLFPLLPWYCPSGGASTEESTGAPAGISGQLLSIVAPLSLSEIQVHAGDAIDSTASYLRRRREIEDRVLAMIKREVCSDRVLTRTNPIVGGRVMCRRQCRHMACLILCARSPVPAAVPCQQEKVKALTSRAKEESAIELFQTETQVSKLSRQVH